MLNVVPDRLLPCQRHLTVPRLPPDNLRRMAMFVEREALGRLVLCRVSDFPGLAHAIAGTPSELQLPGVPCRAIEVVAGTQAQNPSQIGATTLTVSLTEVPAMELTP
jgi:hypothetical protein